MKWILARGWVACVFKQSCVTRRMASCTTLTIIYVLLLKKTGNELFLISLHQDTGAIPYLVMLLLGDGGFACEPEVDVSAGCPVPNNGYAPTCQG